MTAAAVLADRSSRARFGAWYTLAILTLVTLFSYVDRQVLNLLAEQIRKSLGLTDLQLGFLQGSGVAVFAALAAYPLGWLADRYDRRWVLGGSVLVWSLACAACGLARNYWELVFASSMVGAAEAGLVPIVLSLIPMLFDSRRRQLANSIYAITAAAGGGLTLALCGQLIAGVEVVRPALGTELQVIAGWRLSFLAAALPGPVMIILVLTLNVRSPARISKLATSIRPRTVAPIGPHVRRHRKTFLHIIGGLCIAGVGFGAVLTWMPVILTRQFGQTPAQIGGALGTATLVGLCSGFVLTTFFVSRLERRLGRRWPLRAMAVGTLLAAAISACYLLATRAEHIYILFGVMYMFLTSATVVFPAAMQGLSPSPLRGRVVAIQGMVRPLFSALPAPIVGLASDHLKDRPNGLLLSSVVIGVPFLLIAAWLLWRGEEAFAKTADEAEQEDELARSLTAIGSKA